MLEFLTGAGLAVAAGLNAYIPLLVVGLSAKFLGAITLPEAWAWISNDAVLIILGVLLLIELVADKIPAVDTINDWIQTLVRPTAGGLVFASGTSAETNTVTDPTTLFEGSAWVPFVVGAVLALTVHLTKALGRPVLNAVTTGAAAPVVSTAEDAGSGLLAITSLLLPIALVVLLPVFVLLLVLMVRRNRKRKRLQAEPQGARPAAEK